MELLSKRLTDPLDSYLLPAFPVLVTIIHETLCDENYKTMKTTKYKLSGIFTNVPTCLLGIGYFSVFSSVTLTIFSSFSPTSHECRTDIRASHREDTRHSARVGVLSNYCSFLFVSS